MRNMSRFTTGKTKLTTAAIVGGLGLAVMATSAPAAAQFQQVIRNDPAKCTGSGPAVRVNISDISVSQGTVRVQLYRGIQSDWLESGRWIYRMEAPARTGSMSFCMPVPAAGTYAIAVRHDVNNNGRTDIRTDGGAMSNNPSINIFNLGKPSYRKTRFDVGNEVKPMSIRMRYF